MGQSLLRFPVYREAVAAVDKQFKARDGRGGESIQLEVVGSQWLVYWHQHTQQALAGCSILDKLATLPAAELKDTMHAQPASFLVQVGLFELLKSFGVFPDVVLGHSAGEVRLLLCV